MVAHQAYYFPLVGIGLPLDFIQQIIHLPRLGSAVKNIPHLHQTVTSAAPVQIAVNQAGVAQHQHKRLILPVHVPDDNYLALWS